jgi:hypothetical protein
MKHSSISLFFFAAMVLINTNSLQAQSVTVMTNNHQVSAAQDRHPEWVPFASSYCMNYAYDKKTIVHLDSTHMRIIVKGTPKKVFYIEIKSAKMMDHRSLLDYQDRLHPVFDYEGYEKYVSTITEEEIDASKNMYAILETKDLDLNGTVLSTTKIETKSIQWISSVGAIAETVAINLLINGQHKSLTAENVTPEAR